MKLEAVASRIAPAREKPVELLAAAERAHGLAFAPELREWIKAFESYELETIDPARADLRIPDATVSLKAAIESDDASLIAGVIGLFTGTSVFAQQDELSYLAAWEPTESGLSKVFHFHPDDWGLWLTDPSISARVFNLALEKNASEEERAGVARLREEHRRELIDPRLDPAHLFPRVAWLIHLFLAHGTDWKTELASAATIRDWDAERVLISAHPQLALYWLWSHSMFGNSEELEDALELTANSESGLVLETRALIEKLEEGGDLRLGTRNGQMFEAFREQLQDEAPAGVLGSRAKERRDARDRASLASEDEETRLIDGLQAIADRDPHVAEALRLLAHFEQGGALRPAVLRAKEGLTIEEAIDRFVSLIDHRFRPLILAKLRRSARYPDASPHATHGLIAGFQKLAKSFDEFEAVIRALGTGNFGTRRLIELHRAYGRFEDARGTERLAELARAYLAEVESWEPKTPSEAFIQLCARDSKQTHELCAALLERASFSGANAAVALAAADAARRLESKQAVRGLERALDRELGRIDDGSRARVIAAYVACAGKSGLTYLREQYSARLARWDEESDRAGSYAYHHKELACFMSGLLPLAPKDEDLIAKSKEMLETFAAEVAPDKKPRKDVIYALAALLRGIGNGRVRALRSAVEPYAHLQFREDRATAGLADMLRKLAVEVIARL